jgi:hypothetical protein
MSKKWTLFVWLILATLLGPHTALSQDITGSFDAEGFANSLSNVNKLVVRFSNELKTTRIGEIPGVTLDKPLSRLMIDEYQTYGTRTGAGIVVNLAGGRAVSPQTPGAKRDLVPTSAAEKITDFLIERFDHFYRELAPILKEIGEKAKDFPVRLSDVTISVAPLGLGGNITIEINYDSPMLLRKIK